MTILPWSWSFDLAGEYAGTSLMTSKTRDLLIYGFCLPIAVMIGGMLFIANVDSRASAAEFGGLAVFFMLLIALPITVIANAIILSGRSDGAYFKRGMMVPALVLIAAVIYQTGLWDYLT